MQKYAFLDRDGTLIWEPDRPPGGDPNGTFELKSADEVAFMEGALDGLKILKERRYTLVLATNQNSLGTPKHPRDIFDQVMERFHSELDANGIHFEFEMICPHAPDDNCECRKPKIGGLKGFLKEREGKIDFKNSLMFGDRETDKGFAENLGIRFVKIERNKKFELPLDI